MIHITHQYFHLVCICLLWIHVSGGSNLFSLCGLHDLAEVKRRVLKPFQRLGIIRNLNGAQGHKTAELQVLV